MTFITAVCSGLSRGCARRVLAWLPWLVAALCVAAWLWPASSSASYWLFQSPQSPPQEQPPPPTPVPPPPPTPVPVPAQPTPVPPPPPTPVPPAPPTPVPIPPEPTFPLLGAPAPISPLPTEPGAGGAAPRVRTRATALPRAAGLPATESATGQLVISWTKFWDYLAILVVFPWLICGVILFLLAPVGFLYLEIRGRRRPPVLPESLPERPER